MGRPRKEIDKDQFENLCNINATLKEIAGWFRCSEDTIERWCEREYGASFADTYEKYSQEGKISIRRAQIKLALSGNPTMLIWLGRQMLGQTDKQVLGIESEEENKLMVKELLDLSKEGKLNNGKKD